MSGKDEMPVRLKTKNVDITNLSRITTTVLVAAQINELRYMACPRCLGRTIMGICGYCGPVTQVLCVVKDYIAHNNEERLHIVVHSENGDVEIGNSYELTYRQMESGKCYVTNARRIN